MTLLALVGACEAGLLFGLVALGVWLSFRVLDFPDLTVDGSFPLGAAVAATLITGGHSPLLATLCGVLAGAMAGLTTAVLTVRLKIMGLLAGILAMVALFSVDLRVMGKPNISLYGRETVFAPLERAGLFGPWADAVVLLGVVVVAKFAVDWFLATEIGLALRATGANPRMAEAHGVDNGRMTLLGMALSNGLVGLAGALYAQNQGSADVSMGIGTIVVGLAAVILGEAVIGPGSIFRRTLGCVVGALVYRLVVAFALDAGAIGIRPEDLNLVTAVVVAVAVVGSKLRVGRTVDRSRTAARPTPVEAAKGSAP